MAAAGGTMERLLLDAAVSRPASCSMTSRWMTNSCSECCSIPAHFMPARPAFCIVGCCCRRDPRRGGRSTGRNDPAVKVGDPTDTNVQMGPLIAPHSANTFRRTSIQRSTTVPSWRPVADRLAGLNGGYWSNNCAEVTPDATIAQEEVFGPVLSVLRYHDDDDAVRIANNSQYGLSGAVWGTDVERGLAIARQVRTDRSPSTGSGRAARRSAGSIESGIGRESLSGIIKTSVRSSRRPCGLPA